MLFSAFEDSKYMEIKAPKSYTERQYIPWPLQQLFFFFRNVHKNIYKGKELDTPIHYHLVTLELDFSKTVTCTSTSHDRASNCMFLRFVYMRSNQQIVSHTLTHWKHWIQISTDQEQKINIYFYLKYSCLNMEMSCRS